VNRLADSFWYNKPLRIDFFIIHGTLPSPW
jgi:hypothetical protein